MKSPPPPRKRARQIRSIRSENAIVAAAEAVLAREGWFALTMNAVATEADVSVGGIYRQFPSKEDLLRVIKDAVLGRGDETYQEMMTQKPKSLSAAIDRYLDGRIAWLREHGLIFRRILQAPMVDPANGERARRSFELGLRAFRYLVGGFRSEMGHKDPELAIETAYFLANAALTRRVQSFPTDVIVEHIDWGVLREELKTVLLNYLRNDRPQRR